MKTSLKVCGVAFSLGLGVVAGSSAFAAPANSAFTDDNFYKCVISASNKDVANGGNGTSLAVTDNITDEQLASITKLLCSGLGAEDSAKISSIAGIEKMTGLTDIDLDNNKISVANFSSNAALDTLLISKNALTSLVLPASVTSVQAHHNDTNVELAIDASNATDLDYLDVESSKLALPLDLSGAPALTQMKVNHTNIDVLDLTHNPVINVVQGYGMDNLIIKADVDYDEVAATGSTPAAFTVDITRIHGDDLLISGDDPYVYCGESECTYDPTTKKITIASPTKVKDYIQVNSYKLFVPLAGEDLEVPSTSTGIEEKENPDTSEASKLILGLSILGTAMLGVAVKAIVSARAKRA